MQWYVLHRTSLQEVTGKVVVQAKSGKLFDAARYLYEPAPFTLVAPKFKLHYHAKLTDYIHSMMTSALCPLISGRLFDCLRQFKTVPTSRALPTVLISKKGEELPYYVYVQHADFTATDFERSIFCKLVLDEERGRGVYKDITEKVNTYQEVRDHGGTNARVLYLKDNIEWDFFVWGGPPFLWMARGHVVKTLQEAKITGVCYVPFQQGDDWVNDELFMRVMRIEQPKWGGQMQTVLFPNGATRGK